MKSSVVALLLTIAALTLSYETFSPQALPPAVEINRADAITIRGGGTCYKMLPATCPNPGNVNGGCGGVKCTMVPIDDSQYFAPQCLTTDVYTFDGAAQKTQSAGNTGNDGPNGSGNVGITPIQPPYWCGNWYTCDTTSPTYTETYCKPAGTGDYVCAGLGVTANNVTRNQPDPNTQTCPWIPLAHGRLGDLRIVAVARSNGLPFSRFDTLARGD